MIEWEKFTVHNDREIRGFFSNFRWLSNYHIADVFFEGRMYKSTEHAYHAAKCREDKDRLQFADYATSCAMAKRLGQLINIRPDWEQIKFDVMLQLTVDKYTRHPELRELLLVTGSRYLEESNSWSDIYWGVDTKKGGQNRLGEILMRVRALLQPPTDPPTSVTLDRLFIKNFGEF